MKTMILTLAAVSALTATAASAQPGNGYGRDFDGRNSDGRGGYGQDFGRPGFAAPGVAIDAKQAMIAQRIDNGVRNGSLNRREAGRMHTELRNIQMVEDQFKRTRPGLTQVEIAQLDARLDRLSLQLRFERNDRQYGAGYGRW